MKTNVTMVRKMGSFDVSQRTKDGMFNAGELLMQWNKSTGMTKKVTHFMDLNQTKEFLQVLDNEVSRDSAYSVSKCKTNKDGSKIAGETWMHPYLFIDFAMWINPRFKYDVIRFVYDQLIQFRHDAGDNYRGLTKALTRFNNVNFAQVAKGLNYIVFGLHDTDLRQKANEIQLKELTDLQNKLAFAVDMGYIRSFDELINEMRRMWHYKQIK